MGPSWSKERLPPGNTCAEGNELEVLTRESSSIWFAPEISRMLNGMILEHKTGNTAFSQGEYLALGWGVAEGFFAALEGSDFFAVEDLELMKATIAVWVRYTGRKVFNTRQRR